MDEFYVYVVFRLNGIPCYVGKGQGGRAQKSAGRSTNVHLKRITIQSGCALPHVIVRSGLSEIQAFECERAFIAAIGRIKNGGPLVNMTDGGEGVSGLVHSEISKNKMAVNSKGRGHSQTEETKARISAARKNKPLSEEHRKRLSESHRGQIGANKGKKFSDEVRKRMSDGCKGRAHSEETKARMSLAAIGKPKSAETRARMSIAAKLRCSAK